MHIHFLLGPAGSGKTFRCLEEIRSALLASSEGLPLILLAPKQATYQLERALLSGTALAGYSRLHILSFERLAQFILDQLRVAPVKLLSNEGRVMVLRNLLARKQSELKLFHASARLPGFAQELSLFLREMQQYRLSASRVTDLMQTSGLPSVLKDKLHDLALLQESYLDWLRAQRIQDADCLLALAADALKSPAFSLQPSAFILDSLWLDGFAQMTPQERALLSAVVPFCRKATLAFCLDAESAKETTWYSPWVVVQETYAQCRHDLEALPGCEVRVEVLKRKAGGNRFGGNQVLQHLEQHWTRPRAFVQSGQGDLFEGGGKMSVDRSLRVVGCANVEAEATFAAREILRYVRDQQGRFRDVAVLVRELEDYHAVLARVFSRYGIPLFLDRRAPMAHHPLAELTRSALRTIAFDWQPEDWFAALKSGLVNASAEEIDWLENEALARGWQGRAWQSELKFAGDAELARQLETLRQRLMAPFNALAHSLKGSTSGKQLADAIRHFWEALEVAQQLETWSIANDRAELSPTVHATVWEQMQAWLSNVELAFAEEFLPLSQWLPILEAGLRSVTVGIIPPVLDQVLIGSIARARSPDLKQTFVLGVNEGVFPARPTAPHLLTESDRKHLQQHGCEIGPDTRRQIGHENFYGYIALTRAREKVTLAYAGQDPSGKMLNPSSFIAHLKRLFPRLQVEDFTPGDGLLECEHPRELIAPLLRAGLAAQNTTASDALAAWPSVAPMVERFRRVRAAAEGLSPGLAARLYGPVLRTSVSRLEQFAACPFRFFINSGLQTEERLRFEVDARERGSFQHEVLSRFHERVRSLDKEWRDLKPAEAREAIGQIAAELTADFREGLFQANDQSLFTARRLTTALQDFIEVIIGWMAQYSFNPRAVELAFGNEGDPLPAWELDLGGGHRMAFRGKIDRVDILASKGLCVVLDYKSRAKKFDAVLLAHGLQLQLLAYLAALRRLETAREILGVKTLVPGGVFFVDLRGSYQSAASRTEALGEASKARLRAYRHNGRFSFGILPQLDGGYQDSASGQFNYKLTKQGTPNRTYSDVLEPADFNALLDDVEARLRAMGGDIFAGVAKVDPYLKGMETACDQCQYQAICRIDPWTHSYRVLKKPGS